MNLNKKSITDAKLLSFLFSHPQFSLQIEAKKNEDREIEKEREENQKKKKGKRNDEKLNHFCQSNPSDIFPRRET